MKTTFPQIIKTFAHTAWALLGLLFFVLLIIFLKDDVQAACKRNAKTETYLSDKVKIVEQNHTKDLIFVPSGKKLVKNIVYDEYQKVDSLCVFYCHGLYGYVNRNTGALIQPQYEYAGSFRYGLATVVKSNQLYFINRQGKIALPYSYAVPEDPSDCQFHHQHCVVTVDGEHYGVIDMQGKWVVQPIYDDISLCADYCIARTDNQFSKQIDYNGQIMRTNLVDAIDTLTNSNLMLYSVNGYCGLATKNLRVVTQPIYSDISSLGNNRYKAQLQDYRSYIFIDQNGKEIPLQ